jgi:subtilase family serine protease
MFSSKARNHHTRGARIALTLLSAGALALGLSPAASASLSHSAYRAENTCSAPPPGSAGCLGIRLIAASITPADLKATAKRQAGELASGASPAVTNKTPLGGLRPQDLHNAYSLPTEVLGSSVQTIALVDAYNDPTAEADLAVYDKEFKLPACTSANGCLRKLNQEGRTSPLPATEGGWATEISLDVQMAHAICQSCHLLLVEADNSSFAALGAAVDTAVKAGATEISNSYGGAEESGDTSNNAPYDHPGVVITASSGDCGYFNEACGGREAASFPASSPDVVAVGGTSLNGSEGDWSSTVWDDGGSGCSVVFSAPVWQSEVADFSETECGSDRSVADVAANADPYTGVDVYDTTPSGGNPTGWGIWGGTSEASPIVAAEFGLAGGAHGVQYPAQTLYSNIGNSSDLYDVVSGSNGVCSGATSCKARSGYDGPTGVGSPIGLGAFFPPTAPANTSLPTIGGTAEQGQTLTVTHGNWSNSPTAYTEQWALCPASGSSCATIAGATGASFKIPTTTSGYVGATIRVQETASNGASSGAPARSAATAAVISDLPTIAAFTPTSAITGSAVTITGTGLGSGTAVHFDGVKATFTVHSGTQIEATVPNGALVGDITVTTPAATATSKAEFKPTLSLHSFTPTSGAPGKLVTITGLGFTKGTTVSFNGTAATSVTYVSTTQLKATVPSGASTGTIGVTNAAAPAGTVASATRFSVT